MKRKTACALGSRGAVEGVVVHWYVGEDILVVERTKKGIQVVDMFAGMCL